MVNPFESAGTVWIRYSGYEWKTDHNGVLFLTPAANASPALYKPHEDTQALVLDAIQIGRMCMSKKPDEMIRDAILQFALRYGLLGLMTALPTTAEFMEYEAVYLPKNHFIRQETMQTMDYLSLFFPFEKPIVGTRGMESAWMVKDDREMIALAMTMSDAPMAVHLCFQRHYAERYDWLKQQFADWAFIATTSFFYYNDYDALDDDSRKLYQQAMAAFHGNAPTYHVALLDKPTIVWDFHSLLLGVQLMLSFLLTDSDKPLRVCKHCMKMFVADRKNAVFCSVQCKNQHHVDASRKK